MGPPTRARQAMEDLWRERMQNARMAYVDARRATRVAESQYPRGVTPAPDGAFAINQALKIENAALSEYRRVVAIFTDLVVHGKVPPAVPK
jgi:hypothetical protein